MIWIQNLGTFQVNIWKLVLDDDKESSIKLITWFIDALIVILIFNMY